MPAVPAQAAPPDRTAPPTAEETARAARAVCDAIDAAMRDGRHEAAERLARSAERLAPLNARVAERLARLRLAQREPEAALAIIETCRCGSASLRLLRDVCLLQVGRVHEAHIDLHQWARRAAAPLDARLLLALLEWSDGGRGDAFAALHHNLRQLEDPDSLAALLTISVAEGRDDAAPLAQRLDAATAWTSRADEVDLLLSSLAIRRSAEAEPPARQVQTLAMELAACERVIPALVEAIGRTPPGAAAMLLCRALERALPELAAPATAMESVARLLLLQGAPADARAWARRALDANPMSAPAALLLRECNRLLYELRPDDAAAAPAVEGRHRWVGAATDGGRAA